MVDQAPLTSKTAVPNRLTQRLDSLGLTVVQIQPDGRLMLRSGGGGIVRRLLASPTFAQAAVGQLDAMRQEPGQPILIWPSLWLAALPIVRRRRKSIEAGLCAAILIGNDFPNTAEYQRLHEEVGAELAATNQDDGPQTLLSQTDVRRMAKMVHWMRMDVEDLERCTEELQQLSQELADSYEELSLLYQFSCSMTLDEPRVGFLSKVCCDLQQVMGLSWMVLQLTDNDPRLCDLAGRTIAVGIDAESSQDVRNLGLIMIHCEPFNEKAQVINDTDQVQIGPMSQLAKRLLVVPLRIKGACLGILFGGDKIDHSALTSMDATLCSSLANSITIYLQNTILYEDMESMFVGTLKALTSSIDAKDSYTLGHTERVAMLTRQLAKAMKLDAYIVERVYLSGLLHDVGKIGVPESVLTKTGSLTDEEFDLIKKHPEIGARILRDIRQMQDLVPGVLYHHERWDGKGYPEGLMGPAIPLFGRLLCLADAFDAMSSNRTYRDAMSHEKVLEQIRQCRGSQFDPELTDIFLQLDFEPYVQMAATHQHPRIEKCA